MKLSVGSDPEFFLRTKEGQLITAIGLLGGTKNNPRKTKNGWIQEDGVAAELNSKPSLSLEEFIDNHNLILDDMKDILEPMDIKLDFDNSSLEFKDEQLLKPQSYLSGCLPDYNAWLLCENSIVDLYYTNLRAVGGHLHIAFNGADSNEDRMNFTKVLDLELGVPSVILDSNVIRRELYGKAGAHRPKYKDADGFDGIEYRVLSNYWLQSNEYMEFVYNKILFCNDNWKSILNKANYLGEDIQKIINLGSKEEAALFCKDNEVSTYA